MIDALWAFSYLTEGPEEVVSEILNTGVGRRICNLLTHARVVCSFLFSYFLFSLSSFLSPFHSSSVPQILSYQHCLQFLWFLLLIHRLSLVRKSSSHWLSFLLFFFYQYTFPSLFLPSPFLLLHSPRRLSLLFPKLICKFCQHTFPSLFLPSKSIDKGK